MCSKAYKKSKDLTIKQPIKEHFHLVFQTFCALSSKFSFVFFFSSKNYCTFELGLIG